MNIINLLKQRSKILKDNEDDENWLNAVEDQLSKLAVAICSTEIRYSYKISYLF